MIYSLEGNYPFKQLSHDCIPSISAQSQYDRQLYQAIIDNGKRITSIKFRYDSDGLSPLQTRQKESQLLANDRLHNINNMMVQA